MNHGRLQGKRCLITGAARGIGASTARLFAREGASVVLFDLKDELGAQVVADVVKAGGKALYQSCDVTQLSTVSAAVDTAVQFLGGIDVLFNNAGTCIEGEAAYCASKGAVLNLTRSMALHDGCAIRHRWRLHRQVSCP